MDRGYVKFYRKSTESTVWSNDRLWKCWCYCLFRANFQETKLFFAGEEMVIPRGSFVTGRAKLAHDLGLRPSTAWGQILRLRRLGNIDIQSNNRFSIIRVVNYAYYADYDNGPTAEPTSSRQPARQPSDNKPTTDRQQADTDKNNKNDKNDKNTADMAAEANAVTAAWKKLAKPFAQPRKMTPGRKKALAARLRDPDWRHDWREALARMAGSIFCQGGGDHGWIPDFEWFIKPDSVMRLLEGKYDGLGSSVAGGALPEDALPLYEGSKDAIPLGEAVAQGLLSPEDAKEMGWDGEKANE